MQADLIASQSENRAVSERRKMTQEDQQILDQDYPQRKTDRAAAMIFAGLHRGSIRYVMGLFRTEDEQEQFIREGLKAKLP